MLSMVFLKVAGDLAFYYTFAGPFALHFGAEEAWMLLTLAVVPFCVMLSYVLGDKGLLRFVPWLGGVVCVCLPALGLADRIMMLPPLAYALMLMILRRYRPEWGSQVEIFNVFWKVFLAYVLLSLMLRVSDAGVQLEVLMGMVTLVCLVLLMRSLRHEESVYRQPSYQLLNLGLVGAAMGVALLLSSKGFLNSVFAVLGAVYRVIAGVVMRILMLLLQAFAFLFSWIRFRRNEDREMPELNLGGAAEIFGLEENTGADGRAFTYVIYALAILAAIVVLILVFRFLARRYGEAPPAGDVRDNRVFLDDSDAREEKASRGSPVQRVRAQYKRFLRLCMKRGQELKRSDTSLEVNERCGHLFGHEAQELREIYLHARYDHRADKDDALRAKELYARLKKSEDE